MAGVCTQTPEPRGSSTPRQRRGRGLYSDPGTPRKLNASGSEYSPRATSSVFTVTLWLVLLKDILFTKV